MAGNRYPRTARVNELVREVLADELERMSDPRLGLTTITGVEVTGDLRHATVYYTVLGDDQQRTKTAEALEAAKKHLKASLSREVRMKYLPDLHFKIDPAIAAGARVEEILRAEHAREAERGLTDAPESADGEQ
ncbi:MAG: 30S ribosome-binding factor RbfA [Acidimicrobiia bacterium]